jgi:hypothetical protein
MLTTMMTKGSTAAVSPMSTISLHQTMTTVTVTMTTVTVTATMVKVTMAMAMAATPLVAGREV